MFQEKRPQAQRQDWIQCQKAFNPEYVVFLVGKDELILGGRVWIWIYAQHDVHAQMDWYAQVREDGPPDILHRKTCSQAEVPDPER